jgi:hypothetical protein
LNEVNSPIINLPPAKIGAGVFIDKNDSGCSLENAEVYWKDVSAWARGVLEESEGIAI